MTPLKKGPKKVLGGLLVIGMVAFGINYAANHGYIPEMKKTVASLPSIPDVKPLTPPVQEPVKQQSTVLRDYSTTTSAEMPKINDIQPVIPAVFPKNPVANKMEIRALVWAWNSQMGWMLANGGPVTVPGSLMAKYGVTNLHLIRQDDGNIMQAEMIKFGEALKRGETNPSVGAHFVAIMGDGSAPFFAGVNGMLEKLGDEYIAQGVGSCGYSRGEDKFMGPESWRDNPRLAIGGVVICVVRDGDWNIVVKWCFDNKIPYNADETTYDPDKLNFMNAESFTKAAELFVAGATETRPVVKNGKRTGAMKTITPEAVSTWTPGDVTVAMQKGGVVSIVSTKQYKWQMPNLIIGNKKWMEANADKVEGILEAIMDAGDLIKNNPLALTKAAEISARVYNEETGPYWEKYYIGGPELDKTGKMVDLGGSLVNNLYDNLLLFGLLPDSYNLFKATYETFGDVVVKLYPELVPSYPPVTKILNTRFLENIATRRAKAEQRVFTAEEVAPVFKSAPIKQVVSKRSYTINFKTGSAEFTADAMPILEDLKKQILITGLNVEIFGHTDSVGKRDANIMLSEKRAYAVKAYLEKDASANFLKRINFKGMGPDYPVAPNDTENGRSQNRRVEIVLGTN